MSEAVTVKTHEYVASGLMGVGCQVCGFGPGALEHNTTQPEWKRFTDRETFHEPPNYYNRGGYHCFDVMDALGLFTKYYIASAFTYIWRCDFKGDEAEALRDLKKARRYLDWEIKRRETTHERTTNPDPQTTEICNRGCHRFEQPILNDSRCLNCGRTSGEIFTAQHEENVRVGLGYRTDERTTNPNPQTAAIQQQKALKGDS